MTIDASAEFLKIELGLFDLFQQHFVWIMQF